MTTLTAPSPASNGTAAHSASVPEAGLYTESPVVHAEYMLRGASVKSWPFAHAVVRPIFPAPYYDQLLAAFPEDGMFTPLNKYHPDRGALFLTDRGDGTDDLGRLPGEQRAFWSAFVGWFGSERFRRALLDVVGGANYAERYLSRSRSLIHLSLDKAGYQIAPHTDVAKKIITAVFYLPDHDDRSNEAFGTSVLVEKPGAGHLGPQEWAKYDVAYTAPFLANTVFTFAVGSNSWHAVKPVDRPTRRRSIQYFVLLDE
jgi:hypothetical protein